MNTLTLTLVKKTCAFHSSELHKDDEKQEIKVSENDVKKCPKCGKPMLYCEYFIEPYVSGLEWTYTRCEECGYSTESTWG